MILACDGGYHMPLATALRSIAESNPYLSDHPVFILCDHFPTHLRQEVEASQPSGTFAFHWLDIELSAFHELKSYEGYSKITYARLLIPEILPTQFERVLYLDTDVLVLGDLRPLMEADLGDKSTGAVTDDLDPLRASGRAPELTHMDVARYFNSGVLLMDLRRWRERRIAERALEYLRVHSDARFPDQDALNVACDGDWLALPALANYQGHRRQDLGQLDSETRPIVAHFVTGEKPWIPAKLNPNFGFYNSFRNRTRFSRTVREMAADFMEIQYHRWRNRFRRIAIRVQ